MKKTIQPLTVLLLVTVLLLSACDTGSDILGGYNSAPTDITLTSLEVNEGLPIGSLVGTLSVMDSDSGDSHTYSLVDGYGDNQLFHIDGNTLKTNHVFTYDVDASTSYAIEINVNDGTTDFTKEFSITVLEVIYTGTLDLGNAADYSISGQVVDDQDNPVTGIRVAFSVEPDDYFKVLTDDSGNFEFTGLPQITHAVEYSMALYLHVEDVESVTIWPIQKLSVEQGLTVEEIVIPSTISGIVIEKRMIDYDTVLTGTIKNSSGDPIPLNDLSGADFTIGQFQQGPAFSMGGAMTTEDNFYYDETTGTYTIQNCLAGGDYFFHVGTTEESLYENLSQGAVSITPGVSNTYNIVLALKP